MSKTNKALLIVISAVSLGGCASRVLILSAPSLSATTLPPEKSGTLKAGSQEVEGKYCQGDQAKLSKDSNIGLLDEAVFAAQSQSKAKFLQNVSVYQETKLFAAPCFIVSGIPLR